MLLKLSNKKQYDEMISSLEEAVEFYEETDYKYNSTRLFLSDGEKIRFSFWEKNIPHLLGIKIYELKQMLPKCMYSYDLLKELIKQKDIFYKKFESGELNFFSIFSPYCKEKIEAFSSTLKFDFKDVAFVCKYDATLTGDYSFGCDYYIILRKNEGYIFLGLKPEYSAFVPSSIIVGDQKLLAKLVKKQTITFPISVNNYDYPLSSILDLNNEIIELSSKYGACPNVTIQTLISTRKAIEALEKNKESENFIKDLISSLKSNTKLMGTYTSESLMELQEMYNLSVSCKDLSEEIEELERLKDEISSLKEKVNFQKSFLENDASVIEFQAEKIVRQSREIERLKKIEEEQKRFVKRIGV